jgi:hypothetical protein
VQDVSQIAAGDDLITPNGVIFCSPVLLLKPNDLMHLQSRQQEINVFNPNVQKLCHGQSLRR